MQLPLQVTFRHLQPSEAMRTVIEARARELDQFYDHIMSCRVMVEPQHQHKHQGNLFRVRIDVTVPGRELVASRESDKNHAYEDVYVAIRDAFDAMRRQLEDHARRERGKVKSHEIPSHGEVIELVPGADYGRIRTSDGREIYFHRNSILNTDFDDLDVGTQVRFVEEMGEDGPQATSVSLVGKHHVVG